MCRSVSARISLSLASDFPAGLSDILAHRREEFEQRKLLVKKKTEPLEQNTCAFAAEQLSAVTVHTLPAPS